MDYTLTYISELKAESESKIKAKSKSSKSSKSKSSKSKAKFEEEVDINTDNKIEEKLFNRMIGCNNCYFYGFVNNMPINNHLCTSCKINEVKSLYKMNIYAWCSMQNDNVNYLVLLHMLIKFHKITD